MSAPAVPSPRSTSREVLACGLALCAAAFVEWRAVRTFFASDDITFLSRGVGLEPLFTGFRPLSESVAFRLGALVLGLDPFRWHVVTLVLHLLATAGVYALARRTAGEPFAATAAAIVFGASSVAFTAVHWTSGITELLAALLLAAATLAHLESRRRGMRWTIGAAALALLAMLARELAIGWPLIVLLLERGPEVPRRSLRYCGPSLVAAALGLGAFAASGAWQRFAGSAAYARDFTPGVLFANLASYLAWPFAFANPIPDLVAAPDPQAWRLALPIAVLVAWALRRGIGGAAFRFGLAWWLLFLLPVLPLRSHTYLYSEYVSWIGAAIAIAATGRALLSRMPRAAAIGTAAALLVAFVAVEAWRVHVRETATRDFLPADRTMRESLLLRNSLTGIAAAHLAPGSAVLFVSPLTRPPFDVVRGVRGEAGEVAGRTTYFPLEAAMRDGETLRLFFPALRFAGFARTIPAGLDSVEVFHFEQRGYLERWGRGAAARAREAAVLRRAGRAARDSTTRAVGLRP